MKLKEYAYFDRPYEKLVYYGAEALTDTELLSIIIKSGTKNKTAIDISRELLTKEKDIGLSFLKQYSIEELMKVEGIGRVKAIELKAVFELSKRISLKAPTPNEKIITPEQLDKIFRRDIQDLTQEVVETAILDTKNRVIKVTNISKGTINSNYVEIKDILMAPLKMGAPKIAIAHNHPSGDSTPSKEDIEFTKKLNEACRLFGIQLLDHIIVRRKFFFKS